MKVIIPLAGPDFEFHNGGVKADAVVHGRPLLRLALESRSWWRHRHITDSDIIFVLQDRPASRRFSAEKLDQWYPSSKRVFISDFTNGAAFSALAGFSLAAGVDEPVCVDLVDIVYSCDIDPLVEFHDPTVGGVVIVFPSSNPAYSYLRMDSNGDLIEAAEKRVISNQASVGTYFFSSTAVFLVALAHNLRHHKEVTRNSLFYVCPMMNGVRAGGLRVLLRKASDVVDIKVPK